MIDNTPKFTIEFGSNYLNITFRNRDGQEVCYRAWPQDDMSASARVEFISSVEKWVDDSSDSDTEFDISVLAHVIPMSDLLAHVTP